MALYPAAVPGPADTATFSNAVNAGVIDLGAGGVTVNKITFTSATCPSYTLGAGAVDSQMLNFVGSGGGFTGGSGNNAATRFTNNATITLGTAASYTFGAGGGPNGGIVFNGKVYPTNSLTTGTATVRY